MPLTAVTLTVASGTSEPPPGESFPANAKADPLMTNVSMRLAESGYPVITGPVINDRSKPELAGQVTENAALLRKAGIPVAVCTDHPENPIQYLPLAAALTVRAGLDREKALGAITIDAAKIAGIADRVGSITVGKDADLVVTDGDILELGTAVERVWIDGKQVK